MTIARRRRPPFDGTTAPYDAARELLDALGAPLEGRPGVRFPRRPRRRARSSGSAKHWGNNSDVLGSRGVPSLISLERASRIGEDSLSMTASRPFSATQPQRTARCVSGSSQLTKWSVAITKSKACSGEGSRVATAARSE